MGEKILEIERDGEGVVIRLHKQCVPMMPAQVRHHVAAAGREMLLAFRNLLDVAVEYSEAKEKKASHPRTRVKVE